MEAFKEAGYEGGVISGGGVCPFQKIVSVDGNPIEMGGEMRASSGRQNSHAMLLATLDYSPKRDRRFREASHAMMNLYESLRDSLSHNLGDGIVLLDQLTSALLTGFRYHVLFPLGNPLNIPRDEKVFINGVKSAGHCFAISSSPERDEEILSKLKSGELRIKDKF